MPRLEILTEDQLTAAQRRLQTALAQGLRGKKGASGGPFDVWLHSPDFGLEVQAFGEYVRFKTSLPPRISEFAIIICARFWHAQYEWYIHAPIALSAGVPAPVIEAIRVGSYPQLDEEDDRCIYSLCQELLSKGRISDSAYRNAITTLGKVALIELVGLIGSYTLV